MGCLTTVFISAPDEPTTRTANSRILTKTVPQRFFNRRNRFRNGIAQKHGLQIPVWFAKGRKSKKLKDCWQG